MRANTWSVSDSALAHRFWRDLELTSEHCGTVGTAGVLPIGVVDDGRLLVLLALHSVREPCRCRIRIVSFRFRFFFSLLCRGVVGRVIRLVQCPQLPTSLTSSRFLFTETSFEIFTIMSSTLTKVNQYRSLPNQAPPSFSSFSPRRLRSPTINPSRRPNTLPHSTSPN